MRTHCNAVSVLRPKSLLIAPRPPPRVLLLTSMEEPGLPHGRDAKTLLNPLGTNLDLGPTDLAAGDPIKQLLMQRRLLLGFRARHPEDREDRTGVRRQSVDNLRNGHPDQADYVPQHEPQKGSAKVRSARDRLFAESAIDLEIDEDCQADADEEARWAIHEKWMGRTRRAAA